MELVCSHPRARIDLRLSSLNRKSKPVSSGANSDPDCPSDVSEVIDFSNYDLKTTIRLIVLSGEARKITVNRGSVSGTIFIKEGEVFNAETIDATGDEAFFQILSWKNAAHFDSSFDNIPETNIRVPTSALLNLMKSLE
jgi:hypothetical protein